MATCKGSFGQLHAFCVGQSVMRRNIVANKSLLEMEKCMESRLYVFEILTKVTQFTTYTFTKLKEEHTKQ